MTSESEAFSLLREFMEQRVPFNRSLGITVTELRPGFATLAVPFRPDLVGDPDRPALHGGVLSALIDAAGGAAAFSLVALPDDRVSTIDLRVDYLRPAELLDLRAEATVTRMGNRVASVDVRCFHPGASDRLIATGKAVYNVRRATDALA
jgi:uncharacterized protein (TIGR00369 family)